MGTLQGGGEGRRGVILPGCTCVSPQYARGWEGEREGRGRGGWRRVTLDSV